MYAVIVSRPTKSCSETEQNGRKALSVYNICKAVFACCYPFVVVVVGAVGGGVLLQLSALMVGRKLLGWDESVEDKERKQKNLCRVFVGRGEGSCKQK